MKLYFSPGACSLAPHIALAEAGLPYDTVKVDLRKHVTADGTDYYTINPKGYVPFLALDDGSTLSEDAVILQYIADRKPGTLAPAFGGFDRYRLMEWLNFVGTEIHKTFGPLWYPITPEATRTAAKDRLAARYGIIEKVLAAQPYLMGQAFSVADAYLYTITRWATPLKVDLGAFQALAQFMARVEARPAVQKVLAAEGIK
ncbi:MAG: glutathione transferase GstA [Burkholderiales bacterium]|nr:glutathione transferase GstA [Burkholderiales bacterium]